MSANLLGTVNDYYRRLRKKVPIRTMLGLRSKDNYWNRRAELHYYQVVKRLIEEFSPGKLLVDVGAWNTPVVTWGTFQRRVSIDLHSRPRNDPRVEEVVADWLTYESEDIADLIVCLQVLEHVGDDQVKPFAEKIARSGRWAIISVPYMWEAGKCIYHRQDPVDLKKLEGWVGYPASRHIIEDRDPDKRLIAVFKGAKNLGEETARNE